MAVGFSTEVAATEIEARLAALEARVADLEDRAAILQLIALYGPAVDGGANGVAVAIWSEDGQYLMADMPLTSRDAIARMLEGDGHRAIEDGGAAHVTSLPHVTIEGDRAVALCHSRLYRKTASGYEAARVSANRWEFARSAQGWRVERRISRLLDGSAAARATFGEALAP